MKLLSVKRMEFSSKVSMTAMFEEFGKIKAVLDEDKWIYVNRRESPRHQRETIDRAMHKEWNALKSCIPYLTKCMICLEVMQEDICLTCNRED